MSTRSTQPTDPIRLVVIIGSTREGRLGPTVGHWFAALAAGHGSTEVDLIDLADTELPAVHPDWGTEPTPALAELSARLGAADAFVVVTPEYNHSFPAVLKHFIDLHREEWQAKPVGFVSYGGVGGGLRSVEQLRLVFAELHSTTVRETVSFHKVTSDVFAPDGTAHDPEGTAGAAKAMLDQLDWWARALRTARAEHPYSV
ncbi:NAD(P)H-dependent oxidoreductase [Streptomyces scopuliridis]|uniref:NAD(P)H-dependent oxidoreductase n=1 Tax=Streptomyces scopuliridis TaxID=452529 RepID=A0ACD4ZLV2_9ACTN|nr:NAD(P)H-dependent oxidoreductase [Streptomyces scopuliridis]WSB99282.1 NAD(P)H-dependent oxidoreductase [Streptomyces scopuliridis]WSC07017.1 NAD(P)H-dependent oxidoreductase [Streptomyces scopuliridis]